MATSRGFGIADFERAFDEFFDEMLIDRWKCAAPSVEFERAQVIEHRDRYEVRVAAVGVDPAKIQAEVSGQRLAVRVPDKLGGTLESSFAFSNSIDADTSTAKWSEGTLLITLPKKKGRRIALKAS
ncbi:Hsp20/alpha crystallin family protein [Candidatus Binatus soli]|jgi:HSP20 family molecular chaperone IbpA|uniref:Hsp20/alpha crystallin family protein n=1 Tax=Candidatus Binatus soli TaxID=1953413 RepID=UPI003D0ED517